MRVTMKDIAEATGTSVPTVSLILSGKPFRVSEETVKRDLRLLKICIMCATVCKRSAARQQ